MNKKQKQRLQTLQAMADKLQSDLNEILCSVENLKRHLISLHQDEQKSE